MKIYRLEDGDGRGPYTARGIKPSMLPYDPPDVSVDCPGFGLRHVCGFRNLRQLYDWFPRETVKALLDIGIRLCYYEVIPEAVISGESRRQVAFIREVAKGPFFGVYDE